MEFFILSQLAQYEDYKNDTEYEEYEAYTDGFEFAERDSADTWDGQVTLIRNSPTKWSCLQLPLSTDFLTILIYLSVSPPQGSVRGEKGQKGEPAIIEPVSSWRHFMNNLLALVMSMRIGWYAPDICSILPVHLSRVH